MIADSWRGVLPRLTKQYIDDDDVGFKENPLSVKARDMKSI